MKNLYKGTARNELEHSGNTAAWVLIIASILYFGSHLIVYAVRNWEGVFK